MTLTTELPQTRVRGVAIGYVLELRHEQALHARLIDAIPVSLQCPDHIRGQWPQSCVLCKHEQRWQEINMQLFHILGGRS